MSTENNNEKKDYAIALHNTVKYTGFDVDINYLREQMALSQPEFRIEIKKEMSGKLHAGKKMTYVLPFTKSQTEENYFLNSFHATLKRPGLPDISNGFYTDSRVVAREAFNLLEGRAVEKKYNRHTKVEEDGKTSYVPIKDDTYQAWRKIDFADKDTKGNYKLLSYGEGYGFDFDEKLSKIPLKHPLDENDVKDLKKGELLAVTYEKEGISLKGYLEANPRGWNFTMRDTDLKLITDITKALNQVKAIALAAESQAQGLNNELPKEGQNQTVANDQTQAQDKKETIKKNQAIDKDAIQKKNSNSKKKSVGINR